MLIPISSSRQPRRQYQRRRLLAAKSETPRDLFRSLSSISDSIEGLPLSLPNNPVCTLVTGITNDAFTAGLFVSDDNLINRFEVYFIETDEYGDNLYDVYINDDSEEGITADEVQSTYSDWVSDIRRLASVVDEESEWQLQEQGAVDPIRAFEYQLNRLFERYGTGYSTQVDELVSAFTEDHLYSIVADTLQSEYTGNGVIEYTDFQIDHFGSAAVSVLDISYTVLGKQFKSRFYEEKKFCDALMFDDVSVDEAIEEAIKAAEALVQGNVLPTVSEYFDQDEFDDLGLIVNRPFDITNGSVQLYFYVRKVAQDWVDEVGLADSDPKKLRYDDITVGDFFSLPTESGETAEEILHDLLRSGWYVIDPKVRCRRNQDGTYDIAGVFSFKHEAANRHLHHLKSSRSRGELFPDSNNLISLNKFLETIQGCYAPNRLVYYAPKHVGTAELARYSWHAQLQSKLINAGIIPYHYQPDDVYSMYFTPDGFEDYAIDSYQIKYIFDYGTLGIDNENHTLTLRSIDKQLDRVLRSDPRFFKAVE